MNTLSTELWSKNTSHILALRHECSINWTLKQKYVSHPSSSSWILYQLNYEAKTRLTSLLSIMNALSTELWSKNTSHILALRHECSMNWTMKQKYTSHPSSPSWILYQLNYEAKTHLTSSLSVRNALSTELWCKSTSHTLALRHECSINWTMKQKHVSHPRALFWMLYQLNYEAKVRLTSPLSVMNALSSELWRELYIRHRCSSLIFYFTHTQCISLLHYGCHIHFFSIFFTRGRSTHYFDFGYSMSWGNQSLGIAELPDSRQTYQKLFPCQRDRALT